MIDIELVRNNPELVKESESKRFRDPSIVDEIVKLDKEWKSYRFRVDQINKRMNIFQKEIKERMKAEKKKNDVSDNLNSLKIDKTKENKTNQEEDSLIQERKESKIEKEALEIDMISHEKKIKELLKKIGNIVDPLVKVSDNEDNNPILRQWVPKKENFHEKSFKLLNFSEIFSKINGVDQERGSRVCGHRGYYMMGDLARLGNALSQYALDFMEEKGYTLFQTPLFMNKEVMSKTAQLSDFDDQLYSIEGGLYLIATSEQPLTAFHMDEYLTENELPKKYVGQSYCFRKEAGAHGKDNAGIFRVHQFEKIEQFVICKPEDSNEIFKKMLEISCEFYQSLGLKYQEVGIVSGALNDAASIKVDVEAWFPVEKRYRELVSCSNCTDYQSRDLNVRLGHGKQTVKNKKVEENKKPIGVKLYPHMLNSTVCAVQRTLCCIVENYQEEDGIIVPDVLVPYYKKSRIFYK